MIYLMLYVLSMSICNAMEPLQIKAMRVVARTAEPATLQERQHIPVIDAALRTQRMRGDFDAVFLQEVFYKQIA